MKDESKLRIPALGWALRQALTRTGPLTLLFAGLFLVGQPILLLIIGKVNYFKLTEAYSIFQTSSLYDQLNQVLLPLHLILVFLSMAAVLLLSSIQFRFLYRQNTLDRENSLPLNRHSQFFSRLLALLVSFFGIFLANGMATYGLLALWGKGAHFTAYFPLYLRLLLTSLELVSFSLLIFSLSGTLFDAILTNISIQLSWFGSIFLVLSMAERLKEPPSDLLWILAPSSGLFSSMVWPRPISQTLVMILFWTLLAWLLYRTRPAEFAGRRNGQLDWFPKIQPLYVIFGASVLGAFLHSLFDSDWPVFQSPVFYLGLLAGALLGQLTSSVVFGASLRKDARKTHLLVLLSGLVFLALLIWLVRVGIRPAWPGY